MSAVSGPSEPSGTLEVAMAHGRLLLGRDPGLAAEQALEILRAAPNHVPALLLLASAQRRCGDPAAALATIEPLARAPQAEAEVHYEHGAALAGAGHRDEAMRAFGRAVELEPDHGEAWQAMAEHLMGVGDLAGGDAAYAQYVRCSTRDPRLRRAAACMVADDIPLAERVLKQHLKRTPTDAAAIRMLAEVAVRCGRSEEARRLLERCLELAPNFAAARFNYATLLHRQNDSASALAEVKRLLVADARSSTYRNLQAVILSRIGEYEHASRIYSKLLEEYPDNAKVWLGYGHVLKTEGRRNDCIDAYRRSIALNPGFGEAYWSLANLKTFRFTGADVTAMEAQLSRPDLDDENRLHFDFAMGKAREDAGGYAEAFRHYASGNALQRARSPYDSDRNSARVRELKRLFTREFFRRRAGAGCDAPDPIFIVGMPRAGSTLLEQILSSHSAVEGTTELPEIISLARDLRDESGSSEIVAYTQALAAKSDRELRELGERYMERTRIHRKTGRPHFIDKMPNNFLHIGIIQLVLPRARIIDARRHPLGCCFSNFKQYYARGQNFSYDLADVGRFYRDYVELMAHFDRVLPGRIHRVFYEQSVADTEGEVRRLLDYCGLPYEAGCLRFFENTRPVRTASSEQVRQPIYREGIEQWRHYEQWLVPLKTALGEVLEAWPDVPPALTADSGTAA